MLNGCIFPKDFKHVLLVSLSHKIPNTGPYASCYGREERYEFGNDNHIVAIVSDHFQRNKEEYE
jgi:hypothetical protein